MISKNQAGVLLLALAACAATAQCQQQGSFFAAQATGGVAYNGHDWWDVRAPEIPKMQSQAALFATAIKSSPGAFAGMFAELVALVSCPTDHPPHHVSAIRLPIVYAWAQ